jgi:hypothetical protein
VPGAGSVWPLFLHLSWEKRKKAKKKEELLWIILISMMVIALRVCVENVARREDSSRREGRPRDEKDLASHRREKSEDVLLTRVLERHHSSTASIRDIFAQLKRSSGCVLYELRIFNFCL